MSEQPKPTISSFESSSSPEFRVDFHVGNERALPYKQVAFAREAMAAAESSGRPEIEPLSPHEKVALMSLASIAQRQKYLDS